jgi:hypothetical protein
MAEKPMTSTTTPDVIQDAVSYTISGNSNVNHLDDGRQVLANQRNSSKHTNANRYLRAEVAYLKGMSA